MSEEGIGVSSPDSGDTDAPDVGIGMLGYAFMGKAHSNAYKKIPYMMYPPSANPQLIGICGRDKEAVTNAADRYGFDTAYTDWKQLLEDDRVDVFDNGGPNSLHAEPSIAAAEAGKHIYCEKPLARTADEAKNMLDAVRKAGVKHMVSFNYRFIPAIRQAYELIQDGALGEIYHFRARYLQNWGLPHFETPHTWRFDDEAAGSGALGDLGAHIIDLARFLVGEIDRLSASTRTFTEERPLPDGSGSGEVGVDDAFAANVEFDNGAIGTLEASRFAAGRKNQNVLEINGEKGSIEFDLENLNELNVYWVDDEPETAGFHNVNVTEPTHPFIENWWPEGHIIGWEHAHIHAVDHFLDCVANEKEVAPEGATFEDGYRTAVVCDAVQESANTGRRIDLEYQD